jgi:hypothetical protein
MPVKSKRNGLSRKQRQPQNELMYSNALLDVTPSTSAASSPPERTLAFEVAPELYDPEPADTRDPMIDDTPVGDLLGFEEQYTDEGVVHERHEGDEEEAQEAAIPVPPPVLPALRGPLLSETKVGPDSPALQPDVLVDDVDVPDTRQRGHVRSPVLAR